MVKTPLSFRHEESAKQFETLACADLQHIKLIASTISRLGNCNGQGNRLDFTSGQVCSFKWCITMVSAQ